MASEVLEDLYFLDLYKKVSRWTASLVFLEANRSYRLKDKEIRDLLRFADILSNSKTPQARNKAYEIIALLASSVGSDPYYKLISHAVLAKLGNFPALDYIADHEDNQSELPFEREMEKLTKAYVRRVPGSRDDVFTDPQFALFERLKDSKTFSFSGPTSMGKSFIIKAFIRKAMENSPPENIVIMVPTRALINQFSIDLNSELKESLAKFGYKVVTNSNVAELPGDRQKRYIFVLTPERLLSYLAQQASPPLGYLFVDEAHKLAAHQDIRSVTAFTAVSRALQRYPTINLYFASPNVANPGVFLTLFKKDEKRSFRTTESPVSQNLFFIDFPQRTVTHHIQNSSYEFTPDVVKNATSVHQLVSEIGKNGNNIIYCSSKSQVIDKAKALFEFLPEQSDISPEIRKAVRQIRIHIHPDYYLADFLQRGVGYHFGTLPQIVRNRVENLFKASHIHFLFCTSTLLEGVNLPAKSVIILNNKNGKSALEPIDFWNLAGRAGRLKHELSGNIFCLREQEKDWKRREILNRSTEISIRPTVDKCIDKDLKHIEEIIRETPNLEFKSEKLRQILTYVANLINTDTLEMIRGHYRSPLIEKLINENKETIIQLARERTSQIEVPSVLLGANQSIPIAIQNSVYRAIKERARRQEEIRLPASVNYDGCKYWLGYFYEIFRWKTTENKLQSESQLLYYAQLMNQWIVGSSLNEIISKSIDYYHTNRRNISVGYGKDSLEVFNKENKQHVNILIGKIIEDIEKVLRFLFEKYFDAYFNMLVEIVGESNAGPNWATYLEFGTMNSAVIALQNYGLSRHSANYVFAKHRGALRIEGGKLIDINVQMLKLRLNQDEIEYDEISSLLF